MGVTYFKRFRMEVDLDRLPSADPLPFPYRWIAWNESTLYWHAEVKHRCFADELDAVIFPSLGNADGCRRLMLDISQREGFLPEATWLISGPTGCVGTVQGVTEGRLVGMIQNLGVVPEARGMGLGTSLLLQALVGFRSVGLRKGTLEVTAENSPALRIYRRLGFRRARTMYKAVETKEPE